MWKRIISRLTRPLRGAERGQSLIILAFSFIGLIALMGLGLDLGRVYVEKTALKRSIDAAALSGVTELGNEEEAMQRAIQYLSLNGYDLTDSNIYVRGCIQDVGNWYGSDLTWKGRNAGDGNTRKLVNPPTGAPPGWFYPYQIVGNDEDVTNVFWINTYAYQSDHNAACQNAGPSLPANVLGEANKIVVTGTVKVPMSFFGLLGRPSFPVTERAVAQNQDNLDIVVVLDRSGSMEFDPVCYGCYERTASPNASDTPPYSGYYTYPSNGVIYPVGGSSGFTNTTRIKACTTDTYDADGAASGPNNVYNFDPADTAYTDSNNFHYIVMEAELYSLNPAPVSSALQEQGKGYWALQRGEGNYSSNSEPWIPSLGTSIDDDGRPAHMAHHPSLVSQAGTTYGRHYTLADAQSGNAPYMEYDFRFYPGAGWTTGSFYIWVRVHAGRGMDYDDNGYWPDPNPSNAYWALVSRPQSNPFPLNYFPVGAAQNLTDVSNRSLGYARAWNGRWYPNYWRWIRIDPGMAVDFAQNYRFYFFAGSAGYSIDRIVVTDNPSSSGNNGSGSALDPPGALDIRTAQPTVASASRAACDICNAIYGENITDPQRQCTLYSTGFELIQEPTDNRLDPIFDEWEMPLRRTKEAIKFFITRLEPKRDQVGFVYYSTSGIAKTELACKRASQTQGVECTTGPNPISYTTVLRNVEATTASGGTPTAYGMVAGLEVLGIATNPPYSGNFDTACDGSANSSCSRGGGAQRVMILLTDGMPNTTSYRYGCTSGNAPTWSGTNDASHRCPFYFAQLAAKNGITVYTIGLGFGVNRDYLREIARYGNGEAYFSASGGDLNLIFNEILNNIYVRLIE